MDAVHLPQTVCGHGAPSHTLRPPLQYIRNTLSRPEPRIVRLLDMLRDDSSVRQR